MNTKASTVISAIKDELANAGYSVVLFRTIDDENDDLPLISVRFGEDGERDFGQTRPPQSQAPINILWVGEVQKDHELEALIEAEKIRELLIPFKQDRPTVLGGARIEHAQTLVETREARSDTIAARISINAFWSKL